MSFKDKTYGQWMTLAIQRPIRKGRNLADTAQVNQTQHIYKRGL